MTTAIDCCMDGGMQYATAWVNELKVLGLVHSLIFGVQGGRGQTYVLCLSAKIHSVWNLFKPECKVTMAGISGASFLSGIEGEDLQLTRMSRVLTKMLRALVQKSYFAVERQTILPTKTALVPEPTVLGI